MDEFGDQGFGDPELDALAKEMSKFLCFSSNEFYRYTNSR